MFVLCKSHEKSTRKWNFAQMHIAINLEKAHECVVPSVRIQKQKHTTHFLIRTTKSVECIKLITLQGENVIYYTIKLPYYGHLIMLYCIRNLLMFNSSLTNYIKSSLGKTMQLDVFFSLLPESSQIGHRAYGSSFLPIHYTICKDWV